VNYDRKTSKLWFWNSDRNIIYCWSKPSLPLNLTKRE
jgi:hypothetical protein